MRLGPRSVYCVALCVALFGWSAAAEGLRQFQLTFLPVESASSYQIQFLEESPQGDEIPDGPIQGFKTTTVKKELAAQFRFFRIRAIGKNGVPGLWSPIYSVDRFIRKGNAAFREVDRGGSGKAQYLVAPQLGLRAADSASGVGRIEYSLDGSPFRPYQAPLSFPKDGPHVIQYYSIDGAGNRESLRSLSFLVDRTPPRVSLSFRNNLVYAHHRYWTAPGNRIFVQASDRGAGLKAAYCRVRGLGAKTDDAAGFKECPASFALADVRSAAPGAVALEIFAEDRLGNRTAIRTLVFSGGASQSPAPAAKVTSRGARLPHPYVDEPGRASVAGS